MFNVLLDPLPDKWGDIPINTDFRIGIQISQCFQDSDLTDYEKVRTATKLLFGGDLVEIDSCSREEAIKWFLSEYDHDNHEGTEAKGKVMDFDVDQWRIYSAFLKQYGIDLNTARMHWFTFMGLLANLEECNFTRVIDIRVKPTNPKKEDNEKTRTKKAKKVYALEAPVDFEQKQLEEEATNHFLELIGKR